MVVFFSFTKDLSQSQGDCLVLQIINRHQLATSGLSLSSFRLKYTNCSGLGAGDLSVLSRYSVKQDLTSKP